MVINTTKRKSKKGYTLVELTFSIALYTSMVMIALIGFISIFGIYNKAQSLTRTQEEARQAMDILTRDLRQTSGLLAVTPPADILYPYCLDMSGRQVGYGLKFLTDKEHYVLVRSAGIADACSNFDKATLVTSPDVWSDKKAPIGPFDPAVAPPLAISQVANTGDVSSVVWQVRVGVFRGVSAPEMPGFSSYTDQFGAGTVLQSIVISRE